MIELEEIAALTKSIGQVVKEYFAAGIEPLKAQIKALEQRETGSSPEVADIDIEQDGADPRKFSIRVHLRGTITTRTFVIPSMLYQGVHKDGVVYTKGDTITWQGSLWACRVAQTTLKPGPESGNAWQLAAKRGNDAH